MLKHGLSRTRIYRIWKNMRDRCYLLSANEYKNYGGKGIKVCEEWNDKKTGLISFAEWAYSNGYDENLTIDRINVNGDYEPSNCRWLTRQEQNNNTSRNINITYNGETHNIKEWSKILGVSDKTLTGRIRRGWKLEDVITIPVSPHSRYKKLIESEEK